MKWTAAIILIAEIADLNAAHPELSFAFVLAVLLDFVWHFRDGSDGAGDNER